MPVRANMGSAKRYRVGGLWQSLVEERAEATVAIDPRLKYVDYTPGLTECQRQALNTDRLTAAKRKLAELKSGKPQLISVASIRAFPDALKAPFIAATREVPDTAEEYDNLCYLVRVFPDDRVEFGQSRAQMREQGRLVGQGFTVGEIDDNGDYCPLGYDPEIGVWQPIGPDDNVVDADMTPNGNGGWDFTDQDRIGHMFNGGDNPDEGTEVSAAVSGKMDAMSGEEKKILKWVMAGAGRDTTYMENGYQYVIRSGDKEYTLLQKTRSGEINRRQVCATKQQAYELAERWAAEAVLSG